ncbi:uncharacterized protein LOC110852350 [Folsomia candida]|uniref:SPX and EXS domain-containing protein 4 n=1 Tax=Folsomia candida TaxID=158441 RepID=A0A226E311_FOLCA|nr:uncharacterized protein LOC110852350 [Folsomia candida]OXA52125.1 SPX and EXS domain-containing protein 4 [Folsomia candida]
MHPCCGNDLQRGTKIIGIVEIVWYALQLFFVVIALVFMVVLGVFAVNESNKQGENTNDENDKPPVAVLVAGLAVLGIVMLISCLTITISIIFGVILLKGSNQREIGKCKAWMIFRCVMWVLSLLSLLAGFVPGLWEVLVSPYFIWVTYTFIQELKNESPRSEGVVYHQAQKV